MINAHHLVFGRKYVGVATFGNNSSNALLYYSTRVGNIVVDWGDGAIENYITPKNLDFVANQPTTGSGSVGHVYSSIQIRDIKLNIANGLSDVYSIGLSEYYSVGNNWVYILNWGNYIKQFVNLYSLHINFPHSTQTIKGDLSQIPNSLEKILMLNVRLQNTTDLYLNLSNFSSTSQLKYFSSPVSGYKSFVNIYGDLSKLPPLINYFLLAQNLANTLTYTAGKIWASSFDTLDLGNATMSYSDIDNLLNDMNNSITTAIGSKVIRINGWYTNTTAYNSLIAKGFTITGLTLYVPYELRYDFNGNFNEANAINNLVQNGTVTFTTDRKGGNTAIQLGSGYLQTANNLPASNVWSVSFWMKANLLNTANKNTISFYQEPNFRCFLATVNYSGIDNQISGIILTSGVAFNNSAKTVGKTIEDGTWKHVVMIFDTAQPASTEVKIYLNGVLQTVTKPQNSDNTFSFSSLKLILGWTDFAYKGALDDVKIFNRPLTQTEITNLYNE